MKINNDQNFKKNQTLRIFSWGFGKYGQIGSLDHNYSISPVELNLAGSKNSDYDNSENFNIEVEELKPIFISCGEFHTSFIDDKNCVYSYGKNTFGQLGTGDHFISCFPRKINLNEKVTLISCGGEHTIALTSKNELYSWGLGIFGQLGLNSNKNFASPQKVSVYRTLNENSEDRELERTEIIVEIAAGAHHSMILTSQNRIFTCGYNKYFTLGFNRLLISELSLFTLLPNFFEGKISNISAGVYHSGYILNKDKLVLWGIGDVLIYEKPILISPSNKEKDLNYWKAIAELCIGMNFIVFRTEEGNIFSAGSNQFGELGNDSQENKKNFEKIHIDSTIIKVSTGFNFAICINSNKEVYGWGSNKNGQLVDQFLERLLIPKELTNLTELNPLMISCGGYHAAIITQTKSFRNINIIKTFPQNASINLDYINNHVKYVVNILTNHENKRNEIKKQDKNIQTLLKEIDTLKGDTGKSSSSKGLLNSKILPNQELFDEEIKFEELTFPDKDGSIGSGAYGEVKLCKWLKINVAVKFLIQCKDEKIQNENVKLFVEELNILKKLHHPNILRYLGACTKGPYFLVTEYCDSGSLFHFLHEKTQFSDLRYIDRLRIAYEIALGMNYLHSFTPPILHRDLKSLNILINRKEIKIADFGWARLKFNHMSKLRGTYQWMAPEVITNTNYTEKADIFSFAIILWELFSHEPPYKNIKDPDDVATKVGKDPNFRPIINEKIVPENYKKLIIACWDFEPSSRPSFNEICDYLERLITNEKNQ